MTGTPGHVATVKYIVDQLNHPSVGGYYNVTLQDWNATVQESGSAGFVANDKNQSIVLAEFSPSTVGTVVAPLVVVGNSGCNSTDYSADVRGRIALILRGSCTFNQKSALAGAAGAVGAVVYNNIGGPIAGMTLSPERLPIGQTVPTVGVSREDGLIFKDAIVAGTTVTGRLLVLTVIKTVTT